MFIVFKSYLGFVSLCLYLFQPNNTFHITDFNHLAAVFIAAWAESSGILHLTSSHPSLWCCLNSVWLSGQISTMMNWWLYQANIPIRWSTVSPQSSCCSFVEACTGIQSDCRVLHRSRWSFSLLCICKSNQLATHFTKGEEGRGLVDYGPGNVPYPKLVVLVPAPNLTEVNYLPIGTKETTWPAGHLNQQSSASG